MESNSFSRNSMNFKYGKKTATKGTPQSSKPSSSTNRARSSKINSNYFKNTPRNKQKEDVGKEWIARRRLELSKSKDTLQISESDDSTPSSRSESYEIFSSPVKVNVMKREELNVEEDSPPPTPKRFRPKENDIIIEESDASQVPDSLDYKINDEIVDSSPDLKLQQSQQRYDKFMIESSSSSFSSSDSDDTMIMEGDSQIHDRNPNLSQEEAISEALQYLSYRHANVNKTNATTSHNDGTISPDIFGSPIKPQKKKHFGNGFMKKNTAKKEDFLDIKDDDDVVDESPLQSAVEEFEQLNDGMEDDEEEDGAEQNSENSENDETMIINNPDDPEFWYFDSEDTDSNDEEVYDCKNDGESSDDSAEDEILGDPEVDFIKPDQIDAPTPAIITANVISTSANDGLIYTELDNGIIIVTSAKNRVKEKGTLTYEDGTGVTFFGPSIGGKPSRKYIACPTMSKENLF